MKKKKSLLCLTLLFFVVLRNLFNYLEDGDIFAQDKKALAEVFVLYVCVFIMRFLEYYFKSILPAVVITIAASACDFWLCDGIAVLYLLPVSMFIIAHRPVSVPPKKEKAVDITTMLWILVTITLSGYLVFELYRLKHGLIDPEYIRLLDRTDKYYYVFYVILVFVYGFLAFYGKHLRDKQKSADAKTERQRTLYILCVVSFIITALVPITKGYMCFVFPFFDFWCVNLIFLYLEGETILVSLVSRFGRKIRRFLID